MCPGPGKMRKWLGRSRAASSMARLIRLAALSGLVRAERTPRSYSASHLVDFNPDRPNDWRPFSNLVFGAAPKLLWRRIDVGFESSLHEHLLVAALSERGVVRLGDLIDNRLRRAGRRK